MGNIDPYSIYTPPCNNTSALRRRLRGHYVSLNIISESNALFKRVELEKSVVSMNSMIALD